MGRAIEVDDERVQASAARYEVPDELIPTNRQRIRTELSTARLLDAAGEIIVNGGYAKMTLAAIGEAAGYSRGLVTARFGSKEKLLEALIDRIVKRWNYTSLSPRIAGKPGLAQITIFLDAIRFQASRGSRDLAVLYALMFEATGSVPYLHDRFGRFHRRMRVEIASVVAEGIRDGSIAAEISPEREAELIVAQLRGVVYQWRLDPAGFDPVPTLEYLVTTTERRLAAKV